MAGAHRDIGLLLDQVDQAVGDRQIDVDFRIAREEIGQGRGKLVQPEGGAGIDAQPAARRPAHPRHLGLGLIDIGDDPAGAGQERLAFGGERQPAGAAFEQAGAQAVLQARDSFETADGVRPKSLAAAEKLPRSMTRTKTRRSEVASIFVPLIHK